MQAVAGKTALITGGASGIGRGMAFAFAREGMRVVIADVEEAPARSTAAELTAMGIEAVAEVVDVSNAPAVHGLASRLAERFGPPHILCPNAGVLVRKPLLESSAEDWQWLFGVNVFGLVNTLHAFLPAMIAAGDERQVVITASMASLRFSPVAGTSLYSGSKHAVLGIAESLRRELPASIALSVLCPGGVASGLWEAERNRPGGHVPGRAPDAAERRSQGLGNDVLDPMEVGRQVLAGLRDRRPHIITHPHQWDGVEATHRIIADAFRAAGA